MGAMFLGVSDGLLQSEKHRLAPSIMRRLAHASCLLCRVKVWYTPESLQESQAIEDAKPDGTDVVIVCEECADKFNDRKPIHLADKAVCKEQAEFKASQN
jgi:formylmethanofuran dehydrogenase subunit E